MAIDKPEPMPVNQNENEPALWDLVIADFEHMYVGDEKTKNAVKQLMRDRNQFGINKYGCSLKIDNGRDFYTDAMQELADSIVYIKGLLRLCERKNQRMRYDILKEMYKEAMINFVQLYEIGNC